MKDDLAKFIQDHLAYEMPMWQIELIEVIVKMKDPVVRTNRSGMLVIIDRAKEKNDEGVQGR